MRLIQFQVKDFRSVENSGWILVSDVTALIGVNESGKTNLLLPLWKLNPAREGEIEPTSDYPKSKFGAIREASEDFWFVQADFEAGQSAAAVGKLAGLNLNDASIIRVARFYDGRYYVEFPEHAFATTVPLNELCSLLKEYGTTIASTNALKQEADFRVALSNAVSGVLTELQGADPVGPATLAEIANRVRGTIPIETAKTSELVPIAKGLVEAIEAKIEAISTKPHNERHGVVETVVKALPKFVYYSNYGNLDSEIYLPHVVENLKRPDLGSKEAAKVRTLRVLFRFVRLDAAEILELGQDFAPPHNQPGLRPTEDDLEEIAEKKKIRSILLQSAGTDLTQKFKSWWQQGDYRFRFEADGNFFRIWVSDDRRPVEVELENRSTGLQWFLSFYLVFLVESQGEHRNAILLLDEPGMSLHPLAQRDLSAFFDNIAPQNQIIYTSHSPFLVDADRLERARKVYVASDGTTKATSNLRQAEGADAQKGAAYAVYSALNLSVAESLLLGCQAVLVEGPSDQHYLTAIKALLVSGGKIAPRRELVFPPAGGTKTARVVASILSGRDDDLPVILLDSDKPGRSMASALSKELYAEKPDRVLDVGMFVSFQDAEIEDLFPPQFLAEEIDRMEREPDVRFTDVVEDGKPFVGQVEAWAKSQGIQLTQHWKVELAIRVKTRALKGGLGKFPDEVIDCWTKLFEAITLRAAS